MRGQRKIALAVLLALVIAICASGCGSQLSALDQARARILTAAYKADELCRKVVAVAENADNRIEAPETDRYTRNEHGVWYGQTDAIDNLFDDAAFQQDVSDMVGLRLAAIDQYRATPIGRADIAAQLEIMYSAMLRLTDYVVDGTDDTVLARFHVEDTRAEYIGEIEGASAEITKLLGGK